MARDFAVLDFGSGKLTALTGARGVNNTLQIFSMGECNYAGFSGGEWLRPDMLSLAMYNALKAAENGLSRPIRHLYIGVPAEFSLCEVKSSQLSFGRQHKISDRDIEALCAQENEFEGTDGFTLISRQPIYFNLDNDRRLIGPVGLTSRSINGLISYIFAENKFINFVDSIMESFEIDTAEYVPSMLAQALYLLDDFQRDRISVLIDIGHITSSVAVARGDGLLSLSSFSVGGGHISADLSTFYGLNYNEAEALKRKVMISLNTSATDVYEIKGREFPASEVNRLVTGRLSILAKAIGKCLAQCPYEIPQTVQFYLTGGGVSYMRGAKDFLGQLLGRELEIIAPPMPQLNKPHLSSSMSLLNMAIEAERQLAKKKSIFSFITGK